jgi:antirestriction protein ArdC
MADVPQLEQQADDARRAFVRAQETHDPRADELFAVYSNLLSTYNHAWTAEQRAALERERVVEGEARPGPTPPASRDASAEVATAATTPRHERVAATGDRTVRRDVADEVTQAIIAQLESGVVPWHRPWESSGGKMPTSMSTGLPYRGTNALLLGVSSMARGYSSQWWGTYRQIEELGGHVQKGEHGTMVILYKPLVTKGTGESGEEAEERRGALLRSFSVFNAAQCSGLPERYCTNTDDTRTELERISGCELAVSAYLADGGPRLEHGWDKAFYTPARDTVAVPNISSFESPEHYYATLFHELTHSTGHSSRLDRLGIVEGHFFGTTENYAKEELLAEMGAAFACAALGIDQAATLPQSAAYIENWLNALRNDRSLILQASAGAQKAAAYMGLLDTERVIELHQSDVTSGESLASPAEEGVLGFDGPPRPAETSEQGSSTQTTTITIDGLESQIRNFERAVHDAVTLAPEDLARLEVEREMCGLRQQLTAVGAEREEASRLRDALITCQQNHDALTGKNPNSSTCANLLRNVQVAHANDEERLAELKLQLTEYRVARLEESGAQPRPWRDEVEKQFGLDGVIRVAEYRDKWGVEDWFDPFGDENVGEEQANDRASLMQRLHDPGRVPGQGMVR